MQIKKPEFWDLKKPSLYSYLLWPLSKIIEIISLLRIKKKKKFFNIKTICIGNIYIGGTGKTSLAIKINQILNNKNIKTCFLKKFYSNQIDEVKLLKKNGKVFLANNRINCLKKAIKENYEYGIFDDGLQDYSIEYDFKILCFNTLNWVGNGMVIPAGPLRENIKKIKNYKFIFINGNLENLDYIKNTIYKINPTTQIFVGEYIPTNINQFDLSDKYMVFSGIGNHKTFVEMLKKNNFNIIKDFEFPDHYKYLKKDLDNLISKSNEMKCKIITTEKDFVRIDNENFSKIKFVKSELNIQDEDKLIAAILKLNEKY
jgi:tetraacyldisaccharide 4'-kinase